MLTKKTAFIDLLFLFLTGLFALGVVFFDGFPIGDDYKNQIIAYEAFREQIQAGELYPRWLQSINHGFGGANLFFYPPLIYYVSYFIDIISFSLFQTPQILILNVSFFLILSGFTCYLWLTSFCSRYGSLCGSLLYMVAPYHLFIDVYERNNLAEFAAFAWIPLLFLLALRPPFCRSVSAALLSFIYALLLMTHLPCAVFVTPFLIFAKVCHCVFFEKSYPEALKQTGITIFSVFLGACLAGFYLYPALSLLGSVRSEVLWSGPFYDYKQWFLWWPHSPWPEAFKSYGTLLFVIAGFQFLTPLLFFGLFFIKAEEHAKRQSIYLILSAGFCFFLMTPASQALWLVFEPLQKIQFPFRLLMLSDFFFVSLVALFVSESFLVEQKDRVLRFCSLGLALAAFLTINITTFHYVRNSWHPDLPFFEYRIKNRILTGEFMPKNKEMTVSIADFVEKTPSYPLWRLEGTTAEISVKQNFPREIVFQVNAPEPTVFVLRQFHFVGWNCSIVLENGDRKFLDISPLEPYGQISVTLPQGTYLLYFSMPVLPQEKIGAQVSVTTLCISLCFFISFLAQAAKKRTPVRGSS